MKGCLCEEIHWSGQNHRAAPGQDGGALSSNRGIEMPLYFMANFQLYAEMH